MAGHGEDKIVVINVHRLNLRAHAFPKAGQSRHRIHVCIAAWQQDCEPVFKQFGKPRAGPRVFGSGKGVARRDGVGPAHVETSQQW